jgi:hypothetical protein
MLPPSSGTLNTANIDFILHVWNIGSLYRAGSLTTAEREKAKCKLLLVGVKDFRGGRGCTESAGEYTIFPMAVGMIITNL